MAISPPSRAHLVLALLAAVLLTFIVGPILYLVFRATPATLLEALGDRDLTASITLTLVTATAATLLGAGLGVPLAYLLARRAFPGRGLIRAVIDLPVVIPHPVAGIALLVFLGRHSALGGILAELGLEIVGRVPGIIAAMMFVSTPILVSGAREAFAMVDPRLENVARSLGDSPGRAFRRVMLPLAGRGILAAMTLAWARAVSEFGAIVILTYNPKVTSVFVFDRFTAFGLDAAVIPAVVLLIIALAMFALVRLLQPKVYQ